MSSKKRESAVRVVIMDTQYVETDSLSFKSVVQKLTGKDSSVAWIQENNSNSISSADAAKRRGGGGGGVMSSGDVVDKLQNDVVNDYGSSSSVSMLSKGMSFKDLDRLILEVPPLEELQWLWTEYNLHY